MKIVFLAKRYYTNKDLLEDQFGRLFHLPIALKRLGCDVSVFVLDYRHSQRHEMTIEGVLFKTIPCSISRFVQAPLASYFAIKKTSPDVIIASADSHIGYLGLNVAQKLEVPFIFDVYDYYPTFRGNSLPGFKAMFRSAVGNADLVLCASEPLLNKLSAFNSRVLLIENGINRSIFKPGSTEAARAALGLAPNTKVVGYFGSITPDRGPLLISACELLRQEFPELCLLMAGPVANVVLNRPWIRYLGELPQKDIPGHIAACDVVAIPYANDPFNSMSGACKIAEYLACEKPVVATRVAGHEAMFRDAPASLCEPNPLDMLTALKRQLELRQITKFPENLEWGFIGEVLWKQLQGLPRGNNV